MNAEPQSWVTSVETPKRSIQWRENASIRASAVHALAELQLEILYSYQWMLRDTCCHILILIGGRQSLNVRAQDKHLATGTY